MQPKIPRNWTHWGRSKTYRYQAVKQKEQAKLKIQKTRL